MKDQSFFEKRKTSIHVGHVFWGLCAVLLLRYALDFLYIAYVNKFFGASFGAGIFILMETNISRLLGSYLIVLVLGLWLAASFYHRRRPSLIALLLYFIVVMLPLSSLYGLTDVSEPFFYAAVVSFAVLTIFTELMPRIKVPRPDLDFLYLGLTAVLGICAYVYGCLVLSGGLGRFNLDLLSVYEVRAEYLTRRVGPVLGYFIPWQANVINILILCWALHKRKLCLLAAAGIAQVLLFGMTGHKSFLLAPLLASGVLLVWGRKNFLLYLFGGATAMILVSYTLFLVTGNHLGPSLLIRRLFFVPAANHFIYYDFFSRLENPFVMLSNSILAPFIQYPYDMPITRVISWAYWGRDFGPNVGYLGDAFEHFGFMGMFLFSVILGLFLHAVDSVAGRLPSNIVAAVIATPAMALTNSALFTSLLTHGLIPAAVLLWLLRFLEERRVKRGERFVNTSMVGGEEKNR